MCQFPFLKPSERGRRGNESHQTAKREVDSTSYRRNVRELHKQLHQCEKGNDCNGHGYH